MFSVLLILSILACNSGDDVGAELEGTYTHSGGKLTLTAPKEDGAPFTGTYESDGKACDITAQIVDDKLVGTCRWDDRARTFQAAPSDGELAFAMEDRTIRLTRDRSDEPSRSVDSDAEPPDEVRKAYVKLREWQLMTMTLQFDEELSDENRKKMRRRLEVAWKVMDDAKREKTASNVKEKWKKVSNKWEELGKLQKIAVAKKLRERRLETLDNRIDEASDEEARERLRKRRDKLAEFHEKANEKVEERKQELERQRRARRGSEGGGGGSGSYDSPFESNPVRETSRELLHQSRIESIRSAAGHHDPPSTLQPNGIYGY